MALNFPASPTNGQIYFDSFSGNRYIYDAATTKWRYAANNDPIINSSNTQILFNQDGSVGGSNGITFSANTLYANTVNVTGYLYGNGAFLTGVVSDFSPAYNTANAAFDKANTVASDLANTAVAANNYAGAMANSGNAWATATFATQTTVATNATAANNYAGAMANSGNAYAQTIVDANLVVARAYTNTSVTAANNFAGAMANSGNVFTSTVYAAVNSAFAVINAAYTSSNADFTLTNAVFTQSNTDNIRLSAAYVSTNANYAVTNAAFGIANSALAAANQAGVVANNANSFAISTFVRKSGDTITGDLVVQGNVTISGNTTYANTQTLLIGDNIITLNADLPAAVAPSEDAGIEIRRGTQSNVALLWNEGSDRWTFTNDGTNYRLIASNTDVESANNYAGAMANSGNAWATATFATITNAASAFAKANSALANTSGVSFNGALYFPSGNISINTANNDHYLNIEGDQKHVRISGATARIRMNRPGNGIGTTAFDFEANNQWEWAFGTLNNASSTLIYRANTGTSFVDVLNLSNTGNVGIGITTPLAELHVQQSVDGEIVRFQRGGGTNLPILRFNLTESTALAEIEQTGAVAGNIAFRLAGSERARFDTDGRFLVNTISPANSSASKILVGGDLTLVGTNRTLGGNLYYDNAWRYAGTGFGWGFRENNAGLLQLMSAPSGTSGANATISYPVTFNLDNGRVGIGTTSPAYRLDVATSARIVNHIFDSSAIELNASGTGNRFAYIDFRGDDTYVDYGFRVIRENTGPNAKSGLYHRGIGEFVIAALEAAPIVLYTNNTERLRIVSSGNVGIGTSSPTNIFTINTPTNVTTSNVSTYTFCLQNQNFQDFTIGSDGSYVYIQSWQLKPLIINNQGNPVLFTGSSNVGIGTSSPAYKLQVNGSFAATTKSFVIDHPTKPGMKLRYGSLEGPENGVYIRGRTKTNNIDLPDYWKDLVDIDTITVQLTPIGNTKQPSVGEITENCVEVIGNNIDCFYFIQAERKDVEKLIVEFDA